MLDGGLEEGLGPGVVFTAKLGGCSSSIVSGSKCSVMKSCTKVSMCQKEILLFQPALDQIFGCFLGNSLNKELMAVGARASKYSWKNTVGFF